MPIESEKAAKAAEIIRQFMFGALATKVMPSLPILDDAMECEVRLRLVHALAKHYSIDFPSKHVRDLLEELVGIGASGMAIKLVQDVIAPNGKGEEIRLEAKAFLGGSVKEGAQEFISRIIKQLFPAHDLSWMLESLSRHLQSFMRSGGCLSLILRPEEHCKILIPPSRKSNLKGKYLSVKESWS